MIEKYSLFSSVGPNGEPLFNLIDMDTPSAIMEKTAGIHPEILAYKQNLQAQPGKTYVHILALGAGEYYGPNLNNDYFNWSGLSHDHTKTPHPVMHGFKTFLNAHAFAHHVNKDPEKAYGNVLLSVLNEKMKRVELIVEIDHAKCVKNGGERVLQRILAGEYPSTSMGCRVPYDTCSICGNKAKTREQYCQHMKLEAGKIYADGRKVFVYNEFPKFFDISFVFIGADRTSFVLEKVAHLDKEAGDGGLGKSLRKKSGTVMKRILPRMNKKVQRQSHNVPRPITFGKINTALKHQNRNTFSTVASSAYNPQSNLLYTSGPAIIIKGKGDMEGTLSKAASYKFAESIKHSDIFKDVNSLPMGKAVPMLVGKEKPLPRPIIGRLAHSPDLGRSLSEAATMGIMLKPREFQQTLLKRVGHDRLSDELDERGEMFDPMSSGPILRSARISIKPVGGVGGDIMSMLKPMLEERSSITPIAIRRITVVKPRPMEDDMPNIVSSIPLIRNIGSMYNGYRSSLLDNIEGLLDGIKGSPVQKDIERMRGGEYLDDEVLESLYAVPLAYFSHAYWNRCCCDGRTPEQFAMTFADKNPNIARYLANWVANQQD